MIAHIWCPACGLFGLRKRRRARQAADAALIAFHAQLAADVRAERIRNRAEHAALVEVSVG